MITGKRKRNPVLFIALAEQKIELIELMKKYFKLTDHQNLDSIRLALPAHERVIGYIDILNLIDVMKFKPRAPIKDMRFYLRTMKGRMQGFSTIQKSLLTRRITALDKRLTKSLTPITRKQGQSRAKNPPKRPRIQLFKSSTDSNETNPIKLESPTKSLNL